jgi:hypothetical protein
MPAHVAQHTNGRRAAIDGQTTRQHAQGAPSQAAPGG